MRKILKEQLAQVQVADLSNFNQSTNTCFIPKYIKPSYDPGNCYVITLSNQIVNQPTSVWATNWNRGTYPRNNCLKIYVSKILGKMIYVDAVAFDLENNRELPDMWSGWLPESEIKQIKIIGD